MKLEKKRGIWVVGPTEIWCGVHYEHDPRDCVRDQCQARIFGDYRHYQCTNAGKYEVDGLKFCGTHHPERVQARRDKADAQLRFKMTASNLAHNARLARSAIAQAAIDHVHQRVPFDDVVAAVDAYERAAKELEEHKDRAP
jgi:hypothetical protein